MLLLIISGLLSQQCQDDAEWQNNSGKGCADYSIQQWCKDGTFTAGKEWTGGVQFNFPERHCCVSACGTVAVSSSPE